MADSIDDVNLEVVGLILIIVGVVGLVIGLFMMNRTPAHSETVVTRERDPRDPRL